MADFVARVESRLFDSKYSLIRKLAEGGAGSVYLGRDVETSAEVALKLSLGYELGLMLSGEYEVYKRLDGSPGFAKVFWHGSLDGFHCLVLELLGPTLEDLLQFCGGRFSLKTTLLLADQLLCRYETLHKGQGIVHRDVKPGNCMLGLRKNGGTVYVADLGGHDTLREPIEPESPPKDIMAIGTAPFASIRGNWGMRLRPSDDLESLGYMLVYFMRGTLPWLEYSDRPRGEIDKLMLESKRELGPQELCEGLPPAFAEYMSSVRSCDTEAMPDHAALRKIFRELARQERIEYDSVFDWTIRLYLLAHMP